MSFDPVLVLTARYFLALLLLAAGLHKSAHVARVTDAIAAYHAVPSGFEAAAAWLVASVEVAVGAALILPGTTRLASLAAAAVFALYLSLMALNWVRGNRDLNCGCSFRRGESRLSGHHLIRSLLLVIVAIAISGADSGRKTTWVDGVQIAAAVVCLALLYLCVDALLAEPQNVAGREA